MITSIFLPPMAKSSGGLAVLLQIAEHLNQAGMPVQLVRRESRRPLLPEECTVPVVDWETLKLDSRHLWLIPEGWTNALAPGLRAGAHCLVYVQNWAYLFSSLPKSVSWRGLSTTFLAVSRPVAWFIAKVLGQPSQVVRPGIDRTLFRPMTGKPEGPLRVAYMSRKNKALAELIQAVFSARNPELATPNRITWTDIHGRSQAEVAERLNQSHIFLATGFPEGCPLPPLEAMACGCLPVGFAGFGGWEYMVSMAMGAMEGREGAPHPRPWFPIPENPWQGNGFWVPDGDALAAALALEHAVQLWTDRGADLAMALQAGQQTADAFDLKTQRTQVLEAWAQLGIMDD
ncbi:MAG: glycosyltransferase [Desulfovibrionales bacterium]|nr:MAG: glycosyltransferase [Desulfovibrionales bacterium]